MSGFLCAKCGRKVSLEAYGTRNRNHCPHCLHSLHVDKSIGDRDSSCEGLMVPVGRFCKDDGEIMLIHECEKCGFVRWNRIAGDDDYDLVLSLAEMPDPRG
jgi:hypothetical protein